MRPCRKEIRPLAACLLGAVVLLGCVPDDVKEEMVAWTVKNTCDVEVAVLVSNDPVLASSGQFNIVVDAKGSGEVSGLPQPGASVYVWADSDPSHLLLSVGAERGGEFSIDPATCP